MNIWQHFWVIFLMAVTQILFIYCQQMNVNNAVTKNTLKQTKHQTNSWVMWLTKLLGAKFFDPKKWERSSGRSLLVKDRSWESGSSQDWSLTKLTPVVRLWENSRALVIKLSECIATTHKSFLLIFDQTWPKLRSLELNQKNYTSRVVWLCLFLLGKQNVQQ